MMKVEASPPATFANWLLARKKRGEKRKEEKERGKGARVRF
jgi:hypothetical protein